MRNTALSTLACLALFCALHGRLFAEAVEPVRASVFPGHLAYGEEQVYIIENNVAPVMFGLSGDAAKLTYPLLFELDVPPAVRLYSIWNLREVQASADGRRYAIELTQEDVARKLRLENGLSPVAWIAVWAEINEQIAGSRMEWRFCAGEETYSAQTAELVVKPALPEEQHANGFDLLFSWQLHLDVPKELWERVFQLYRACGINCLLRDSDEKPGSWREYLARRLKEDGGKNIFNSAPGWPGVGEALRSHGEDWLLNIAEQGADGIRQLDQRFGTALPAEMDAFYWDAEFINPYSLPYGKATLAAFAGKLGLDPQQVTVQSVKTTYAEQYRSYCMDDLAGKVIQAWAECMKGLKPGIPIIAQQGDGANGRGQDIASYDVEGIAHAPMIYQSSAKAWVDMMELTSEYARQPLMPTTTTGLLRERGRYANRSPESLRMDILATAMLGEAGLCFWPDLRRQMDANYMWNLARASTNIRSVEEFFKHGNRIDQKVGVGGLAESESEVIIRGKRLSLRYPEWRTFLFHRAFQINKERLVAVLNLNEEKTAYATVSAKLNWPADNYHVHDAVSGTQMLPSDDRETWNLSELGRGVLVEIPPLEAVFLRMSREPPASVTRRITVRQTQLAYEQLREKSEGTEQGGELEQGNLKITWDDIDNDGTLDALLVSPAQKVWITTSGGRIWACEPGADSRVRIPWGENFGMGMDLFWMPEGARWNTSPAAIYRIVERGFKGNRAYVTLQHTVSTKLVPGLAITKTYSIDESHPDIHVLARLANESPEPLITFSYWSHNVLGLSLQDRFVYPTETGVHVHEKIRSARDTNLFAHKDGLPEAMVGFASRPNLAPITGDWFGAWDEQTGNAVTVTLDKDALMQIYRWSTKAGDKYSLEWMYQPVELGSLESWETEFTFRYRKDKVYRK